MPRRRPFPTVRGQFPQRQGMPIQAQMQRNPGQMAGQRMQNNQSGMAMQARTQARNPMAGRAEARQNARGARRQRSLSGGSERASARPAGLKAEWQQSFWFQIPILGGLVDLLRNLVYPQEHLRTMKRAFVGTGIGPIAKNRAMARLGQRRPKNIARQQALVQKNRVPMARNTIAGQQARKRARSTHIFTRGKKRPDSITFQP